jgi:hypothetical protein
MKIGIQHWGIGVEPRAPSGAHDQIFITVWLLRSCYCGAPSLAEGRVCLLHTLLALASTVFLGSESLGTRDHILLSQIWEFPFRRLLRLAGSTPPSHGITPMTIITVEVKKVKVILRLTVSQSVNLGVEPQTRYLLLFYCYGLVFVGHPLSREDRSLIVGFSLYSMGSDLK